MRELNLQQATRKVKNMTGQILLTDMRGSYWICYINHIVYFYTANDRNPIQNIQTWKPGKQKQAIKHQTVGGAIAYINNKLNKIEL